MLSLTVAITDVSRAAQSLQICSMASSTVLASPTPTEAVSPMTCKEHPHQWLSDILQDVVSRRVPEVKH